MAAGVVVIGAGLGIWQVASGGGAALKGPCVSINIASSTGGAMLAHCGTDARSWCAAEARETGEVAGLAQAACRKKGLLAEP